jgi:hypothetical protein
MIRVEKEQDFDDKMTEGFYVAGIEVYGKDVADGLLYFSKRIGMCIVEAKSVQKDRQ